MQETKEETRSDRGAPPTLARRQQLVQALPRCKVMVVGDLMLDRYVWGRVERISPEAPVPVVQVVREETMLGGAGNVVRNLASLGAQVWMAAVVGGDESAAELRRRLDVWKVSADDLVEDATRPTTVKTRVIAGGQQVVRYDLESEEPIPAECAERLVEAVRGRARQVDGAIFQDYGKGMLTAAVVRELMEIFSRQGVRVFVDPKPLPWDVYRGAELIKPNLREAREFLRERIRDERDLARVGRAVLDQTGAQMVAITRSEEGMTLFAPDRETLRVPTLVRAVADTAGAGDTAIATLTLARLAGAEWSEAAQLANAAAGVVVQMRGTATVSPEELLGALAASA